jgi:hypothetical protein
MTARIDSLQRSVAVFGSLMITAMIVFASQPNVPFA